MTLRLRQKEPTTKILLKSKEEAGTPPVLGSPCKKQNGKKITTLEVTFRNKRGEHTYGGNFSCDEFPGFRPVDLELDENTVFQLLVNGKPAGEPIRVETKGAKLPKGPFHWPALQAAIDDNDNGAVNGAQKLAKKLAGHADEHQQDEKNRCLALAKKFSGGKAKFPNNIFK